VTALSNVTMRIGAGQVAVVEGPSGSGKTTLLHVAIGLQVPTAGQTMLFGTDIADLSWRTRTTMWSQRIGFVYQAFHLLPFLTAYQNVELPMRLRGCPDSLIRVRVGECLNLVGLESRGAHLPSQLSGGEQQRVAIARSIVNSPDLVVADEPTGNLDDEVGQRIAEVLVGLCRDLGTTVVIATHDSRFVPFADQVIHLDEGRATIEPPRAREAREVVAEASEQASTCRGQT
jgi:putative ABC transport system ATP-binding protein